MEGQYTTSFQLSTKNRIKEIELHNYLSQWKNKHNRNRYYKKEDFCYDGFMYNTDSNAQNILYIFDYKYNDRQSINRIWKMQRFISKHCLDYNITVDSISYLILNKTNSKCIDTKEYVKNFEKQILGEIELLSPSIIVSCGCYKIVKELFNKYNKSRLLSAINHIPIIDMLPPTIQVSSKLYQLHFEYLYFRKFGWNI